MRACFAVLGINWSSSVKMRSPRSLDPKHCQLPTIVHCVQSSKQCRSKTCFQDWKIFYPWIRKFPIPGVESFPSLGQKLSVLGKTLSMIGANMPNVTTPNETALSLKMRSTPSLCPRALPTSDHCSLRSSV